jgi:antitoxin component HigA of HigAB toxin-antitoxin module
MNIKVIKTEEDYNQALQRLEKIFHAPKNSIEGDEAEILTILIEKYEDENYSIEAPGTLYLNFTIIHFLQSGGTERTDFPERE